MMRFGQKLHKRRSTAEEHGFKFIPFTFSHNGQTHPDAVRFVCSQIDHKLRSVDGQAIATKKTSIWKLWARHVCRNTQRKVAKMVNASNSAQRQATSSTNCDDAFSTASELAEELK